MSSRSLLFACVTLSCSILIAFQETNRHLWFMIATREYEDNSCAAVVARFRLFKVLFYHHNLQREDALKSGSKNIHQTTYPSRSPWTKAQQGSKNFPITVVPHPLSLLSRMQCPVSTCQTYRLPAAIVNKYRPIHTARSPVVIGSSRSHNPRIRLHSHSKGVPTPLSCRSHGEQAPRRRQAGQELSLGRSPSSRRL